jgi:large subunit ribosomal protein L7/L12
MAVATQEEMLEAIANMTVMDVVELVKAMEDKFGVSAAAPVAMGAIQMAAPEAEAAPEQTEFTVTLTSFGEKKVQVIKTIRGLTGLGLKEAKELVEGVPSVVKEAIPKDEAEKVKKDLEEAGGAAEIK